MVQEIITYLLVAYAFGYTLYGAYGLFRGAKKSACAGGCGSSGCSSKSVLIKEVRNGKKPFLMDSFSA
jgi:hypothetical protein